MKPLFQRRVARSFYSGMALPMVLLLVAVGMVIVIQLHQLSTESYRRSMRGIYGTLSEILAQSAAEEALYNVQRWCNDPNDTLGIFQAFRRSGGTIDPIPLPILKAKVKDGQFSNYITDRYDVDGAAFSATAEVTFTDQFGPKKDLASAPSNLQLQSDGTYDQEVQGERFGVLKVVGTATSNSRNGGLANYRRVEQSYAFKIVLITPPPPFDGSGLFVINPLNVSQGQQSAELASDAAPSFSNLAAGKSDLVNNYLKPVNDKFKDIGSSVKTFNDAYKAATSPVCGDHLTPPPKWIQDIIDKFKDFFPESIKVDVDGSSGRRPYFLDDSVWIGRLGVAGNKYGDLDNFNYGRKIKEKIKPLKDLTDKIQNVQNIINDIVKVLSPIHAMVPYGLQADALAAAAAAASVGLGLEVHDVCYDLHNKFMDPILQVLNGVSQVLSLVQKIVMEVSMMGQQAFAQTMGQIASASLPIDDPSLVGVPNDIAGVAKSVANGPQSLSNFSLTGNLSNVKQSTDLGSIADKLANGFIQVVVTIAEKQLVSWIMEQITSLIAQVGICSAIAATGIGEIASQAGCTAISFIVKGVMNRVATQLNRIASFKKDALGAVVGDFVDKLEFINDNPVLKFLKPGELAGNMVEAAYDDQPIDDKISAWFDNLMAEFGNEMKNFAANQVEPLGGVLKGFVLRHRMRNLVELDPKGAENFAYYRQRLKDIRSPEPWKAKATWIIHDPTQWKVLQSRYINGTWISDDKSGDGTWASQNINHYQANKDFPGGYGLNGIVYYDGTQDLTVDFASFTGKLIIFTTQANVVVNNCVMRDINKDCVTVISWGKITLPAKHVEIAAMVVGDQSTFSLDPATDLLGVLFLNKYDTNDEQDASASFKGQLQYNDKLNARGGDAPGSANVGLKDTHLFATISPFCVKRDVILVKP